MIIDDLKDGEVARQSHRTRRVEVAAPLGFSSITRGALRVASPEGLIVEGSEKVSGTLDVTGTLTNTGTTNLNGPTVITGDATVNGPLHVDGDTDINGATTLNGDLAVAAGGGITIDSTNPLKLSPDSSHAIEWASGAYLQSNDGGVGIGASGHSAAFVAAVDGSAALYYSDGHIAVWTSSAGITFYSPDGSKTMQLTNSGLVGP